MRIFFTVNTSQNLLQIHHSSGRIYLIIIIIILIKSYCLSKRGVLNRFLALLSVKDVSQIHIRNLFIQLRNHFHRKITFVIIRKLHCKYIFKTNSGFSFLFFLSSHFFFFKFTMKCHNIYNLNIDNQDFFL